MIKSKASLLSEVGTAALLLLTQLLSTTRPTVGTKIWVPTVDITHGSNWIAGQFPSPGHAIVFPAKLNAIIALPSSVITVSSLVLPQQGALLFPDHSFVLSVVSLKATEMSVSVFKAPGRSPYYSGRNWATYDESVGFQGPPRLNQAVPHVERVPCQYEMALFPMEPLGARTPQPIDMQYHESIEVGSIQIGTGSAGGFNIFQTFLRSELGQYLFYNADDTIAQPGKCPNAEKCPCQEEHQMDAICSNERPCPIPHCLHPIQPTGHCCPLCGSLFKMNIATFRGTFDLRSFSDKLRRKISSGEVDDAEIDYHVGIDRTGGTNIVQVVIVDRGEYREKSLQMMNSLQPFFDKQFSFGYQILHSGQPHTSLDGGQVFGFVIVTLLATTMFFTILYVYYYDEGLAPRLRAVVRNQNCFATPFVFARFDPNSEADGLSVDVNFTPPGRTPSSPENASTITDGLLNATSFDNPMYGSGTKEGPLAEAFDDVELHVK